MTVDPNPEEEFLAKKLDLPPDGVVIVKGRASLTLKGIVTLLKAANVDDGLIQIIANRIGHAAITNLELRRKLAAAQKGDQPSSD